MGTTDTAATTHDDGSHAAAAITSYAAATGERLGEVRVATPDEARATVARARKAQAAWALLPVEERCERLLRLRDALVDDADAIVEVVSRECGKPKTEALSELAVVADLFTYYLKNAKTVLAQRELGLHLFMHKRSVVTYVPRGVVGVISPSNFPFTIPMVDVVTALVAGNAVVVKPSELTPLSLQKAKDIHDATGLPEDLFGVVHGGGDVAQALVASGIQRLVFTGGVETGRAVAAACGANLVPCVLELGGNAPLVVCADADVERAARGIVFGGFINAGQACVAVERVYAHEAVHDELVARVDALTRALRQGDPASGEVDVGALIHPERIGAMEAHVADALAKGAELVTGGKRRAGRGTFFEPTVLTRCDHTMTVMRQEVFGPIVPIMKVSSEDEAVRLANDSDLGLNAYVFTKDRAKGTRLADRIEAGSVLVNDVVVNYGVAEAPFGGVKQSGYGRVHGDDALREMCEPKHVLVGRVPEPSVDPLGYPYSSKTYRWQARLVKALYSRAGFVRRLGKLF